MMELHSESAWTQYVDFIKVFGEVGQRLVEFFTTWAELAEKHLDDCLPIEALRTTLPEVPGFHPDYLGPSMLLIATHWAPIAPDINGFFDTLNPIEQAMYQKFAMEWAAMQTEETLKKLQDAVAK